MGVGLKPSGSGLSLDLPRTVAVGGGAASNGVFAENADELVEKARTRSLSPLAGPPDRALQEGLSALLRDSGQRRIAGLIVDHWISSSSCAASAVCRRVGLFQ